MCFQQANGTMPAPARRVRLHRAIGSDSVYAGLDTFQGALDAVSVWSVALTRADIQAAMLDTSSFWAIGVCVRVCVTLKTLRMRSRRTVVGVAHLSRHGESCLEKHDSSKYCGAAALPCLVPVPTLRAHFRRGLLVHV